MRHRRRLRRLSLAAPLRGGGGSRPLLLGLLLRELPRASPRGGTGSAQTLREGQGISPATSGFSYRRVIPLQAVPSSLRTAEPCARILRGLGRRVKIRARERALSALPSNGARRAPVRLRPRAAWRTLGRPGIRRNAGLRRPRYRRVLRRGLAGSPS